MSVHQCLDAGCGCDCTIATDTFDTDLSSFSTTGTPTVSGGLLTLNAGDGVVHNTVASSADDGAHLEVDPQTASATATLRLKAAWSDNDNYLFGEWAKAAGAATIRLWQRVAGSEMALTDAVTVEDTGAELAARSTMQLCWQPGAVQESEELVQGPHFPSTVSAQGGGGDSWSNLGNITGIGSDADSFITSPNDITETVFAEGFPFSVPPGSTIDGIRATIGCYDTDSTGFGEEIQLTLFQLLDIGGNPVGDDKGTGQVVPPTLTDISVGGEADDWNAGLNWEDINSPGFGIAFQFTLVPSTLSGRVFVDYVTLSVFYTTPDRRPGKLTFTYHNTGSATIDCVREYSAFSPADGLKAGIASVAGDFDFPDFAYSYLFSAIRPDCPDCDCTVEAAEPCACCDPAFPPAAAMTVDIGTPFSGDGDCTGCAALAGIYEVEAVSSCLWVYREPIECEVAGTPINTEFTITLRLQDDHMGGCKWTATIQITGACNGDPADVDTECISGITAHYASASIATDDDCQTVPVTLTEEIEFPGTACVGGFPATITLDLP